MKNSCASRELSVGELARRAGVAVSALHFYETKGLISSQRNAGNQRRFSRETLRRVVVIKVAQRVGIPLAEIARALQTLPAGRSPSAADWARLSAQWKEDLTERIDKLLLLRDHAGGDEADIRLLNCSPDVRKILSVSNFEQLFVIA